MWWGQGVSFAGQESSPRTGAWWRHALCQYSVPRGCPLKGTETARPLLRIFYHNPQKSVFSDLGQPQKSFQGCDSPGSHTQAVSDQRAAVTALRRTPTDGGVTHTGMHPGCLREGTFLTATLTLQCRTQHHPHDLGVIGSKAHQPAGTSPAGVVRPEDIVPGSCTFLQLFPKSAGSPYHLHVTLQEADTRPLPENLVLPPERDRGPMPPPWDPLRTPSPPGQTAEGNSLHPSSRPPQRR